MVTRQLPAVLRALDSRTLRNYRSSRYDGSGYSISLSQLSPADQDQVRRIYAALRDVSVMWHHLEGEVRPELLEGSLRQAEPNLRTDFPLHLPPAASSPLCSALHDTSEGALRPLLSLLQPLCASPEPFSRSDVVRCLRLVLDQAKMMRNAFHDLDLPFHKADERRIAHSIHASFLKWRDTPWRAAGGPVHIEGLRDCEGYLSCSCSETAAIDRVVYSLLGRAVDLTADRQVTLAIDSVPDQLICWTISFAHEQPDQLSTWLDCSSDASLQTTAELVARCFGLGGPEQAFGQRYCGCCTEDGRQSSWFHWPRFLPCPGDECCGCLDAGEV